MPDNRVAIITGASHGIGRATAVLLADLGIRLVLNYNHSQDEANELVRSVGSGQCFAFQADITVPDEVGAMRDATIDRFGRIDILVNNAGQISAVGAPAEIRHADCVRDIDVNLMGVMNCILAFAGELKKSPEGRIVNLSSTYAIVGDAEVPAYVAAKAGVITLTRSYARMLAPNVTVNAVAPSIVDTPMTRAAGPEAIRQAIGELRIPRMASAYEIARTIAFFIHPESSFITGQVLAVDGGHCLR